MDRVVIYDPDLQLGAIIDTDEMRALGPVGGGANARAELEAFDAAMPEVVFTLTSYDLAQAYMQFWADTFSPLYEAGGTSDKTALVEPAGRGNDESALAEHTASASAGEPPEPAPADADMEADAGETDAVADNGAEPPAATEQAKQAMRKVEQACFACAGKGTVPGNTGGDVQTCNLCKGTGKIVETVPA